MKNGKGIFQIRQYHNSQVNNIYFAYSTHNEVSPNPEYDSGIEPGEGEAWVRISQGPQNSSTLTQSAHNPWCKPWVDAAYLFHGFCHILFRRVKAFDEILEAVNDNYVRVGLKSLSH